MLNTTPKKYQIQAVRAVEVAGGRFVLGDDMGLGKTLEAIGWLALHPEVKRVVVVCPAHIKYQWQDQLWKHASMRAGVAEGRTPHKVKAHILIINYTILASNAQWPGGKKKKGVKPSFPWVELIRQGNPQLVILDECHYTKDRQRLRTMAVRQLCQRVPHIIGASGTPVDNTPAEFFTILQLVAPKVFTSFWRSLILPICAERSAPIC